MTESSFQLIQSSPYIDAHTHHGASTEQCICFHTYRHGIHPWLVKHPLTEEQYQEYRLNPPPYLGEVGIDRVKGVAAEIQQRIFDQYLKLAKELHLPIIIHAVRSYQDILQVLKANPYSRVMVHGFRGNAMIAQELQKHQCFLSFGAALLSDNKLQETITCISLDKLFLETDDQHDISIQMVYAKAASLLNIDLQELKDQIYANALVFFGEPDDWKKMD